MHEVEFDKRTSWAFRDEKGFQRRSALVVYESDGECPGDELCHDPDCDRSDIRSVFDGGAGMYYRCGQHTYEMLIACGPGLLEKDQPEFNYLMSVLGPCEVSKGIVNKL